MYKKVIEGFSLYKKKPNTITSGSLYTKEIIIPVAKQKERTLRVWLPDNYDGKKRFGVIYMTDGQNIVDKYTTLFGEWNMEEHISNLQKVGYEGYIIVGVDCCHTSHLRSEEYSPWNFKVKEQDKVISYDCYGKDFARYIVKELKPFIDKTFMTKPNDTGFAGSSMGGLFSFYIGCAYPDTFGFVLAYSPAFFLFKHCRFKHYLRTLKIKPSFNNKFVFYSGSKDEYESNFVKETVFTYKYFKKKKFSDSQILLTIDKDAVHSEYYWSKHVEESLFFVNK